MSHSSFVSNVRVMGAVARALFVTVLAVGALPLRAQTDYYNTGAGRPLRIEDAAPVEYRAIELDLAPLRWEGAGNATYRWSLHPEVALGVLPRTQLQIGMPFEFIDGRTTSARGAAGLEIAALHALNTETSIPAMAVAADVLLPIGSLSADATYATLKGLMTRTLRVARIHANAQITMGPTPGGTDNGESVAEVSRWLAGVAVDKTFPLRSVLISAEAFAEQPLHSSAPVAWNAAVGARAQLAPRWALDAGVGRRLTGDDRVWFVTFGSAYALGFP